MVFKATSCDLAIQGDRSLLCHPPPPASPGDSSAIISNSFERACLHSKVNQFKDDTNEDYYSRPRIYMFESTEISEASVLSDNL